MTFITADDISYVIDAHTNHSIKPSKAYRKHDGTTPAWVHPLWCATSIAAETALPQQLRSFGARVLLFHDVLEDTTRPLPYDNNVLEAAVLEMTFPGGMKQEIQAIWQRSLQTRLFKLYDKTNNLMDGRWMDSQKYANYCAYAKRLADDVERHYGALQIIALLKTVSS
jgi:hypothetical protein